MNLQEYEDPYKLDLVGESYPALTAKNARFIEAVISLDSNYKRDNEIKEPDKKFNMFNSTNNVYCGSSKYWFNEMMNGTKDYKECLLGAIISIDRMNSTHIEAAKFGRIKILNIIYEKCKNLDELKEALKEPFDINNNHLINLISTPLEAMNKNSCPRINLSFATKFCAYACKHLNLGIEYSKYDFVVAKSLPAYCNIYLDENLKEGYFLANNCSGKMNIEEKKKYKLEVYKKYSKYIERIINEVRKKYNYKITKEEFDHILWYGFKGN